MDTPLSNHSHNSILSIIFDPFMIGPNHAKHSYSSSIVKLEESHKIFCPLCLENVSLSEVESLDEDLFDQYIKNLFEALDQHSEKDKLRKIVVRMLEIILSRRTVVVKSEPDFHNFLRVIHKTMKSEKFNHLEYASMTKILSVVLAKFAKPLPLVPIWKVLEHALNFGEVELDKLSQDYINTFNNELCRFFSSLGCLIKVFLQILTRLGIDRVSDIIFPVFETDTAQTVGFKYYELVQKRCLRFMVESLFPKCWRNIGNNERELSDPEKTMVSELFGALRECHITAVSLKDENYLHLLEQLDYLKTSYSLIYKNTDNNLRHELKIFIKRQIDYYVRHYFKGNDKFYEQYMESDDIVETNHKNAILLCSEEYGSKRTLFYLLINCVALKQSSNYFNSTRVKKVLKVANPTIMGVYNSPTLIMAYCYLAAHATAKVTTYETIGISMRRYWKKLYDAKKVDEFNEIFCTDEIVFYWAYEQSEFIKMVRPSAIVRLLSASSANHIASLIRLLQNENYKNSVRFFFKRSDSAIGLIEELTRYDSSSDATKDHIDGTHHERQVADISSILIPLFNQSILESYDHFITANLRVTKRLTDMLIILMENCKHFDFLFNNHEIADLIRLMEKMYKSKRAERVNDTLISLNYFIAQIMKSNHPSLMKILNKLDFCVLGYMYDRLADYTTGDRVAESIGHVLIAYINIDYPLVQDVRTSLHPMALSIQNWTMSRNNDLHILSLTLAQKVLSTRLSPPTRISVATGLFHMLCSNAKILDVKIYRDMLLSIINLDEFRYNPLLNHVLTCIESSVVKDAINEKLSSQDNRAPSPVPSFDSDGSSFDEERHMTITQILQQLHDEGDQAPDNVPNSLYISSQHTNTEWIDLDDVGEWETTALEASQIAEPF